MLVHIALVFSNGLCLCASVLACFSRVSNLSDSLTDTNPSHFCTTASLDTRAPPPSDSHCTPLSLSVCSHPALSALFASPRQKLQNRHRLSVMSKMYRWWSTVIGSNAQRNYQLKQLGERVKRRQVQCGLVAVCRDSRKPLLDFWSARVQNSRVRNSVVGDGFGVRGFRRECTTEGVHRKVVASEEPPKLPRPVLGEKSTRC